MFKKLLPLAVILLLAGSTCSYAQLKMGYMNTQKVMNNLPQRQQVQDEMNAFVKKKREALKERSTKFQHSVSDYNAKKATMSDDEIKNRENELQKMSDSLDKFNATIRKQVQQERAKLLSPVFARIDSTISVVAKAHNLDLVLNKSTNAGEKLIFYASDNQTDITDMVINRLKSTSQ